MAYIEDYHQLKALSEALPVGGAGVYQNLTLRSLTFQSNIDTVFPGGQQYYTPKAEGISMQAFYKALADNTLDGIIQISDAEIAENKSFRYLLLQPKEQLRSQELIIFFHGLNEKDWSKYLPWGQALASRTGKSVLFFPLAFHIDRAIETWVSSRPMNQLSKIRTQAFDGLTESSFTNAAISARLHLAPVRFFLSGLATYNDVIQLVTQIRMDNHPHIHNQASVDFFGFSAGAFLTQILMMANRGGLFEQSRAALFCGGNLLSDMRLTSRYILDSCAHQAVLDFFVRNLPTHLDQDPFLRFLFQSASTGGAYFQAMLSDGDEARNRLRQDRFETLSNRLAAFSLAKDNIMLPEDIQKALRFDTTTAPIIHRCFDFDFPYSHMNPFPIQPKYQNEVMQAMDEVFGAMADFYTQSAPNASTTAKMHKMSTL
jgi:hypothetical protein